jgi:hypothetical protein
MTKADLDRFEKWALKAMSARLHKQREREKKWSESTQEYADMAMSGRIALVGNGTKCNVIEAGAKYCKVKILGGQSDSFGKTVWVFSSTVVNM